MNSLGQDHWQLFVPLHDHSTVLAMGYIAQSLSVYALNFAFKLFYAS